MSPSFSTTLYRLWFLVLLNSHAFLSSFRMFLRSRLRFLASILFLLSLLLARQYITTHLVITSNAVFFLRLLVSVSGCEGQSFHFVSHTSMNADPDVLNVNSTRPMSAARLPSGRKYPILYTVSPSEVGGNEDGLAPLGITVLICTNSGLP